MNSTPAFETTGGPAPAPGVPPPELAADPDYEVLRELGRGSMGVVYLARNRVMDRLEAVKVTTGPLSEPVLAREVRAAARLAHPNVVAAYAARRAGAAILYTMEYVAGQDLQRLVTARGPLPVGLACEFARQAALGLQHAHDRGLVHRDVKPGNLIVTRVDGRAAVKVADFGIAGATGAGPAARPGEAAGTPAYAAPEQLADPAHVDPRADVYALGGTLVFLLTGEPPFPGDDRDEIVRRHREEEPRPVGQIRSGVPSGLSRVVARMLAKDPADRYPTAADAAAALAPYATPGGPDEEWVGLALGRADTEPTVVYPPPPPPARPRRRGPAAAAAAVVALGLAAGWYFRGPAVPPADPPAPPGPEQTAPAPVPLFDGKTLAGWVVDGGDAGEWRVERGVLVTTGAPKGPRTWLLTDRDFGDGVIRFEYRLQAGGNTGLAFRAVPGERPKLRENGPPTPGPYHLQVELADDADPRQNPFPTGQIHGGATSRGTAMKPDRPARLRPAAEWNAAEVEFRGQRVRVSINGAAVLDGSLTRLIDAGSLYPGLTRAKGRLGFQQQAGRAEFRNITIEEPPKPAAP